MTFSFWVKSNKTGTFTTEFRQRNGGASTHHNINQVTINSANTWEYKTVSIVGNTSTTIDNDNTSGIRLFLWLKSGSDFNTTDVVGDGYVSYVTTNIAYGADIDITTSTSDYFAITGVKLEVGSVATEFDHRSYGEELQLCRRYYRQIGPSVTSSQMPLLQGLTFASSQFQGTYHCEDMRTQPTLHTSGTAGDYEVYSTTGRTATNVPYLDGQSEPAALDIRCDISGATAGQGAWLRTKNTSAYLGFDAEL